MSEPRPADPGPGPLRRLAVRSWRLFRAACVAYVCVEIALASLGYLRTEVISPSMAPTLAGERGHGDRVLVDTRVYRRRAPRRGELLYIVNEQHGAIIKRVAALPGEVVGIVDGRLHVNGKPVLEPAFFATKQYRPGGTLNTPEARLRVLSGHYFVLGDNSADSQDSRYLGAIPEQDIAGRCVLRYWPPGRLGSPE